MRALIILFAAFAVLVFCLPALAQEDTEGADTEATPEIVSEEVVVTATRGKSSWKDAPVMVTVISKEELENSAATTVDDYLRLVPGITVKRQHMSECGPGREMTLRGVPDQRRTLVLVDGVPMNDGFGGSVNWSLIPKETVERIEIVRGPMSALYGSGAMGGVINIITKMPAKQNETTIKGSYGSLDTYSGSILQGGMFDKHGYMANGRLYDTDGYQKVEEPEPYHEKNARSDWSLLGRYYYLTNPESMLSLTVYSVDEDYSRGHLFDHQNNAMSGLNLTYEKETSSGIEVVGTVYGNYNYREVGVGGRPTYDYLEHSEKDDIFRYGELFSASFPVGQYNRVTAGIDSTYNQFEKKNIYEPIEKTVGEGDEAQTVVVDREGKAKGKQYIISLFAQDEATFHKKDHKFIVTVGGRGDYCKSYAGAMYDSDPSPNPPVDEEYDDKIWLSFNPKAGFVYRYADWTTVRLSAGRAFAAPTLSALYMVFARGPITSNGNPELEPETALSGNVGIDQWFTKNFFMRVDGYFTQGDNFIGSRMIAENTYMNDNITKVQIYGGDAELRYNIIDGLSAYAGYTYNLSTIFEDEVAPDTEGNELSFEPKNKGRLGVTYDNPKYLTADLSANYVGERYTDIENTGSGALDSYVSLDLYLARMIGKHTTVAVSGENLLDERYKVYSLPSDESFAPGILVTGSLTFGF